MKVTRKQRKIRQAEFVCVLRWVQELNLWELYTEDSVASTNKVFVRVSVTAVFEKQCCSVS